MTAAASPSLPRVAITMGDPAGIGPELCLRVLNDPAVLALCTPLVFGDVGVLARVAAHAALPPPTARVLPPSALADKSASGPAIVDCGSVHSGAITPGTIQAGCGRAALAYIGQAVDAAMADHVEAVVTAPVHKEALHAAGCPHPGHTELLAELTGTRQVCMMMASDDLIVSLATIHVGLAQVPELLSIQQIVDTTALTIDALRRLGKASPRVVLCGLNPHAGEGGLFGREEIEIIAPAIAELRRLGFAAEGPIPADTAFIPERRRQTDAYIAMYHDQGLIPFKMLAFERGVNITLGLPIVRTSVDHGTAFDIAWQGRASPTSLVEAIRWAVRLAGTH
ncbi:MAG: 4-hydroxythreonine-4-phosphate dehydrogenase PdxA [Verrucomicrobia bacterium]|nr:4-hydroxythreonine-4-phosphate dehydrogenase PdxA [Verrucomicrobiota bacterium]